MASAWRSLCGSRTRRFPPSSSRRSSPRKIPRSIRRSYSTRHQRLVRIVPVIRLRLVRRVQRVNVDRWRHGRFGPPRLDRFLPPGYRGRTLRQKERQHMTAASVSRLLAERIATFRYQDLPADLIAHTKLYVLDTLGAMLVASAPRYPASRIIMRFVDELGGVAESSLVGQGTKTSCVNAALANGTLGYYCDVEPHHVGAILHGLAVMVPTSLAVGEKQRADGKRLLASIILGVEVAARVSYAFDPVKLYDRGFHPSAICGAFGAAAAAGYLFRLNPERQAIALGLAMQQASGLIAWANDHKDHSRPFNPGLAARNGTTAACLARLGFGGPPTPFEGKYDAFTAFSGASHPEALLDDWVKHFHLPECAYHLY